MLGVKTTTPEPGLFKTRLYSKGPWVPVKVTEISPAQTIISKRLRQIPAELRCEWAPLTNRVRWFPINLERAWPGLHPITEGEFKWLIEWKKL